MTKSREQINCQLFLKLAAVTFMMNIFFPGLEHLKLAVFPFYFMAQKSEVILEGMLNFPTHSNNVSVLHMCMQNLVPKHYALNNPASTVCNNKTLSNIFKNYHIWIVFLFLYCLWLFFTRPSLHSDHQEALAEKHTATIYSCLFLYVLVHCLNQSISYFSGRPPSLIVFTSSETYLPFSLAY